MKNIYSLFDAKQVHLVGIKGVAMTALAQLLVDLGKTVTGSDVEEAFVTEEILQKLGIQMYVGFSPEHLHASTDYVVFSGAHNGSKNTEVLAAKGKKIPAISHAEALGQLMQGKIGISVCGVGGKSTVTAMIAWILEFAGMKPSYAIGVGQAFNLGRTGKYVEESDLMVVEADEYATDPLVDHTPRFMFQTPTVIVCTNLEYDHPDIFNSIEDVKQAYLKFFQKLPDNGTLVINGGNAELENLATQLNKEIAIVDISSTISNSWHYGTYSAEKGKTSVQFLAQGMKYTLDLIVPGKFNALNALYATAAAFAVGVPIETSLKALKQFTNTMRRFEDKGIKNGVQYYDDYAHHPIEIEATLTALREWYPKNRVIAAFQSHTYSRTKILLNEFAHAFTQADKVVLIDIFPSAREVFDSTISSDVLAEKIGETGKHAKNLKTIQGVKVYIQKTAKPGDVVITLGAGDLYHIHELINEKKPLTMSIA